MKPLPRSQRTSITAAVRAVVRDAAFVLPELRHVRASRVLVIAGEARRNSRATIRPLTFSRRRLQNDRGDIKPAVRFKNKQMLYVITLRPLFFRNSTPEKRVETILHEMFHISTRFDGTLHKGRRHSAMGKAFKKRLNPLVRRYLKAMKARHYAALAQHGLVPARQWLEKPGPFYVRVSRHKRRRNGRSRYTEAQTFVGLVRMVTPPRKVQKRVRIEDPNKPSGVVH